jgi:hypothetical protein
MLNDEQREMKAKVGTYDKYAAVFSTACFTTVLSWAAVSNFKYSFCHLQWFITIGALAATLTDLACLAVFIWNLYKLLKLPANEEKPFQKTVIGLELVGSLIATVGTFFFAAHIDQELSLLSKLHLSAIPLPPEWVAPMMFLFALSFFSVASLLNIKAKKEKESEQIASRDDNIEKNASSLNQSIPASPNHDEDNKELVPSQPTSPVASIENNKHDAENTKVKCSALNWVNFFSFVAQIPAIGFLLYQSAAGNIPAHVGFHANNILITTLFIGALGALSLLLDGLGLREKITTGIANLASSNCCHCPSLSSQSLDD